MINRQIFENKPLVFLRLDTGERILLPWTEEKLKHKLSFDFLDTETGRIIPTARNIILDSGRASAYDYFVYYDKKSVEPAIVSRFLARMAVMSDTDKHKLTNAQIWGFIEKIREEEKYYTAQNTPQIPPERLAEMDAQIRARLSRCLSAG